MIIRSRMLWLLCAVCLAPLSSADEIPPGLVSTDSEQDLIAAESQQDLQAQKREASLSNSYGDPLPPDAYGPPRDISINVADLPAPVYGVPDLSINSIVFPSNLPPPGAYGPPSPINLPNNIYQGPPPPIKPKPHYGPPKAIYGPPKPVYGPPKKSHKQSLPKPIYGAPFKNYGPPKSPKPVYGVPKPVYGPPKPVYGPPIQNLPLPELPPISLPQNFGHNLPAPIYGTPLPNLPLDLKPNFPVPSDSYGPPGHQLGPIGPEQQIVLHDSNNLGHYGPPQPDPNPRPPHPGIPAPPTPPHVLYDGWKPIPGVSQPLHHHQHHQQHHQHEQHQQLDEYGPPPPPSGLDLHLEGHLPNLDQPPAFSQAQVTSGYSHVHQDALSNIDLNAIVGGDSNHIDQSKTVFEAHYTEPSPGQDIIIHTSVSAPEKPLDSYGAPPLDSFSANGPYPASLRQHGAKGLVPPSGIYGVPPGHQHGAPQRHPSANLPLPYGTFSGSTGSHSIHTGGSNPRHPIKFRESVPEGLFQQIGDTTNQKDSFGLDHLSSGPKYIPPPIREVKDINTQTHNHGISVSIEPTHLYSLPHAGNAIQFNQNTYGTPADSYGASSDVNAITAALDGTILANLSNLDAAAILKHCPYHEAILRAAKLGEKIPSDLASNYVASLSTLGNTLKLNQNRDLAASAQNLVQTILIPDDNNNNNNNKIEKSKGKSLKESKQSNFKAVSEQIMKTSEKIRYLSDEAKQLQQKIVLTNQNLHLVNDQLNFNQYGNREIPVKGQHGSYTLQIQSADEGNGKRYKSTQPSIPHEQLLSEGLLQSILQAIEQPSQGQHPPKVSANVHFQKSNVMDLTKHDAGGLVLPAGYEPVDRTRETTKDQAIDASNIQDVLNKEMLSEHNHRGDIPLTECDLKADNSVKHTIVVPLPTTQVDDVENDVAIYFDEAKAEEPAPVTEISVSTSISEEDDRRNAQKYGKEKEKKEFGEKIKKN